MAIEFPTFVHLGAFDRKWAALGLTDDDLRELQAAIMAAPDAAPVVSGTHGLRKRRFAGSSAGRGKRDAYRVLYAIYPNHATVLLVAVYGKNEKGDISQAERRVIGGLLQRFGEALDQGGL